ncbi:SGNH/GDSL hydrolase family protein [Candidatus Omnitrophota bacterium]
MLNKFFKSCLRQYSQLAIILLTAVILFIVANISLGIFFKIKDSHALKMALMQLHYIEKHERLFDVSFEDVYPNLNRNEINDLLGETWNRSLRYEPFTQFKESARKGTYVNVDESGFRHCKDQAPWPPNQECFNVFLFGGSTTFNYGLPDNQTIATYLQEALLKQSPGKNVCVYNFGRGYYYSSQERILFEKLLTEDHVPNLAIFIDGLNEIYNFEDRPYFSDDLEKFIDVKAPNKTILTLLYDRLPITRLARSRQETANVPFEQQSLREILAGRAALKDNDDTVGADALVVALLKKYTRNKLLIENAASMAGVIPVFVWQPVPTYNYDLTNYRFVKSISAGLFVSGLTYPIMKQIEKQGTLGNNFLWCADIQKDTQESLYVDQSHYNATMSKRLASYIVEQINERDLLVN